MTASSFHSRIIDYVFLELEELNLKKSDDDTTSVDPEVLSSVDALHYCGNLPILKAIQATTINKSSACCRVLDIGSGLGSPARMLTHFVPYCRVDAYTENLEFHQAAQTLTRLCGLDHKDGNEENINQKAYVKHLHGDYLCFSSRATTQYDAMMSFMGIMYVKDRRTLFQHCARALQDGGRMYVEDLVLVGGEDNGTSPLSLTVHERDLLTQRIGIPHDHHLPTLPTLLHEYTEAGFAFIEAREMTPVWMDVIARRLNTYTEEADRHERVHGQKEGTVWRNRDQAILDLLRGGHICGIAYTVQKECSCPPVTTK